MLHFKASILIFFSHVQLPETETPFFSNLCRVTGKTVHRKISSFLHTDIDSRPSAYIDPNSIFTSKFSKFVIYFWFSVNMKETAVFPEKIKNSLWLPFVMQHSAIPLCRKM